MSAENFQQFIFSLCDYWVKQGCLWSQPYDFNMGAGTFHPHTFLKGLGPEPWRCVYVQPCRRPVDGRYGKSPYRFQHYYQLQVFLKPAPANIIDVFLQSLEHIGIGLKENDIGLLEDDWQGPTLGAWGLGWEVRANGQEVTQFTYFQQLGGLDVDVVGGEITYGLERLYMYAKGYKNALDIPFNEHFTYGDLFEQPEFEFSHFNFHEADVDDLFRFFNSCEEKVFSLCEKKLVLPAYDYVLQASHLFNLLDARGAISVSERQRYIGRVRESARKCALLYRATRENLGFPLCGRMITASEPKEQQNDNATTALANSTQKANTQHVLFELGVEEMPPRFQISAKAQLEDQIKRFDPALNARVNVSARRLSVQFLDVPAETRSEESELWGPAERIGKNPDGTLSPAGLGFCKKNGLQPDQIEWKTKDGALFLFARKQTTSQDTAFILAKEFQKWCYSLTAPLKMKWLADAASPSFIRPVRWIVALADDRVLPLDMFGLQAGRHTRGQRILHPHPVSLARAQDYENTLKTLNVEISADTRRELILNRATELARSVGGIIAKDDGLLEKCAGLCEHPEVFLGRFSEKYLTLPSRLITSALREHMNFFSVLQQENPQILLPYYVGVAGYPCTNREAMIKGTEDVVVGRLEDGAFYHATDLSTPLATLKESLGNLLFQTDMGTMLDKSERMAKLATMLCTHLPEVNASVATAAAAFCKADLKTGCVQEFPDALQGVMGALLIRKQNLLGQAEDSELCAQAVEEHMLPTGAQSPLPSSVLGCVVSLVDKIDALCLMTSQGIVMKATKDPLGLRRLALGVVRLLGIGDHSPLSKSPLTLNSLIQASLETIQAQGFTLQANSAQQVGDFFLDRIKAFLKDEFDIRLVDALAHRFLHTPLTNALAWLTALAQALKTKEQGSSSLATALEPYKRARNLSRGWEKQDVEPQLFRHDSERVLFDLLQTVEQQQQAFLKHGEVEQVLHGLTLLAKPIASFFAAVLVNDKDEAVKHNRLSLLRKVCLVYENIAEFSLIQVS